MHRDSSDFRVEAERYEADARKMEEQIAAIQKTMQDEQNRHQANMAAHQQRVDALKLQQGDENEIKTWENEIVKTQSMLDRELEKMQISLTQAETARHDYQSKADAARKAQHEAEETEKRDRILYLARMPDQNDSLAT